MKELRDVLLSERTRDEFAEWAAKGTVVIVPISSLEQHGEALPVNTDSRTVVHVAREAARSLDDVPVLVIPLIPFGISPHHMQYSGTITISVNTLVSFLSDVCGSLATHGFDRILILSGHGGNENTIAAAALELTHKLGRRVDGFCWFSLCQPQIDAATEGPCHTIGHAGEAEGSCILALSPESFRKEKARWVQGISDDPSTATAEKGRKILAAGVETLAEYVRKMAAEPGRKPVGIRKAE